MNNTTFYIKTIGITVAVIAILILGYFTNQYITLNKKLTKKEIRYNITQDLLTDMFVQDMDTLKALLLEYENKGLLTSQTYKKLSPDNIAIVDKVYNKYNHDKNKINNIINYQEEVDSKLLITDLEKINPNNASASNITRHILEEMEKISLGRVVISGKPEEEISKEKEDKMIVIYRIDKITNLDSPKTLKIKSIFILDKDTNKIYDVIIYTEDLEKPEILLQ